MGKNKDIAGYRLLGKKEIIKNGDVAGWASKIPIDINLWGGQTADRFNQAVFRPMHSFVDLCDLKFICDKSKKEKL